MKLVVLSNLIMNSIASIALEEDERKLATNRKMQGYSGPTSEQIEKWQRLEIDLHARHR